jgi:hypothetical protein
MAYVIPIKAEFTGKEELAALLSNVGPETSVMMDNSPSTTGLAMDPATVALIFGSLNIIVPSIISALAVIWVEHIKNRKTEKLPESSQVSHPTIIIETDSGEIHVTLDRADVKGSVEKARLPESIEEITRIRLET